jgi:ABC-type phosphate transport system substrate-binding protein
MDANMKTMRVLAGIALAAACCARAEVVVVVNKANPVGTMTAEQVAQIYTGASKQFPDGSTVAPFDQPESSPVREEFLGKVVGKNGQQVSALWSRLMFSGKGTRPKPLAGSAEVKREVSANPAAIGFMERSAVDDSVKVVLSVK